MSDRDYDYGEDRREYDIGRRGARGRYGQNRGYMSEGQGAEQWGEYDYTQGRMSEGYTGERMRRRFQHPREYDVTPGREYDYDYSYGNRYRRRYMRGEPGTIDYGWEPAEPGWRYRERRARATEQRGWRGRGPTEGPEGAERSSWPAPRDFQSDYERGEYGEYGTEQRRAYARNFPYHSEPASPQASPGRSYNPNYPYRSEPGGARRAQGQYGEGQYERGQYQRGWERGPLEHDVGEERWEDAATRTGAGWRTERAQWWEEGPYTGRGPSGYARSDQRIEEDVCERLTQHGNLDASNIAVEVEDGVVTLRGEVDARRAKRMAENTAQTVMGIHDVQNRITLRRQGQQQSEESEGEGE